MRKRKLQKNMETENAIYDIEGKSDFIQVDTGYKTKEQHSKV